MAHFTTRGAGCATTGDAENGSRRTVCNASPGQEWTYLGPSLDLGGQTIFASGVTIGASLGAHYRFVAGHLNEDAMPFGWTVSHGSGFRPRARLWVGWAFF